MGKTFRQSMTWLHTWSGLLIGWLLFAMFLTGTAAVFQNETTIWMTPEMGRPGEPSRAAVMAQARLQAVAPHATRWTIDPPDERSLVTAIAWKAAKAKGGNGEETLESATGKPVRLRDTRGGEFFYHFHYRFETPSRTLWWLSGSAAIAMLVGLTSGVIIHKRFFRNIFTFRPRNASQRSWLDAHNVLAVLALPFHFMITYTGLLVIIATWMPWGAIARYHGDQSMLQAFNGYDAVRSAYLNESSPPSPKAKPAGEPAPLTPLGPLLDQAHARWHGGRVGRIEVLNPGDRNAMVQIQRHEGDALSHRPELLVFDGVSGRLVRAIVAQGAAENTRAVMYGMHMARFAAPVLRWVYFLLGLASTGLIGTGLIYWTAKRRPKRDAPLPPGNRVVEGLNIGTIVGLPIAMASMFWANRLLPADMAGRAGLEVDVFFWVWIGLFVAAALRPARRAWTELLSLGALAYLALPLLDVATVHNDIAALVQPGGRIVGAFDLGLVAIGAAFAFAAFKSGPKAKAAAAPLGPVAAMGEGAA